MNRSSPTPRSAPSPTSAPTSPTSAPDPKTAPAAPPPRETSKAGSVLRRKALLNPDIHKLLYPNRADPTAPPKPKPKPRYCIRFSPTEQRVLEAFVGTGGDANKVIARVVGLAEATVKIHIKALFEKSGCLNRTQLALWAVHHGLVPMPKVGLPPAPQNAAPENP